MSNIKTYDNITLIPQPEGNIDSAYNSPSNINTVNAPQIIPFRINDVLSNTSTQTFNVDLPTLDFLNYNQDTTYLEARSTSIELNVVGLFNDGQNLTKPFYYKQILLLHRTSNSINTEVYKFTDYFKDGFNPDSNRVMLSPNNINYTYTTSTSQLDIELTLTKPSSNFFTSYIVKGFYKIY